NVTTEDKKQGISNFFEPVGVTDEQTGSGGVLKGLAMSVEGALRSDGSPPRVSVSIPTFGSEDSGSTKGRHTMPETKGGGYTRGVDTRQVEAEKRDFETIAAALRQSVQEIPELSRMQDSLVIEKTPEGLRIQLLDDAKLKMFMRDTAALSDRGRHLLAILSSILVRLPYKIAITGHTSSPQDAQENSSGIWETSGLRAENARQALLDFGVSLDNIARIAGKGDSDPLDPNRRQAPRNNRISVLLMSRHLDADTAAGAADAPKRKGG
ncbi:MAG: OmpA family protein, partial [Alphaproteobacteria bacterium]|nr:OmpA family protein [Alphaproteobacteria bacterium]